MGAEYPLPPLPAFHPSILLYKGHCSSLAAGLIELFFGGGGFTEHLQNDVKNPTVAGHCWGSQLSLLGFSAAFLPLGSSIFRSKAIHIAVCLVCTDLHSTISILRLPFLHTCLSTVVWTFG